MMYLTEHTKTILRALADGKQVEYLDDTKHKQWWTASLDAVLYYCKQGVEVTHLRVKPAPAQPVVSTAHGPWIESKLSGEEGERYCLRCLLRDKFLGSRDCEPHITTAPAHPADPQGYQAIGWVDRRYGYRLHDKPAPGRQVVYVLSNTTAPAQLDCSMSWGGFNLHGDAKSIEEAKRMLHEAGLVPQLKQLLSTIQKAPAQQDKAYREAKSLAEWLFKTHYASEEAYASGRVVWEVLDTTVGVLTQIDNMVAGLKYDPPTAPAQQPLTKDQTMEMANSTAGAYWGTEDHLQRFRIAIEAAHGIKGASL